MSSPLMMCLFQWVKSILKKVNHIIDAFMKITLSTWSTKIVSQRNVSNWQKRFFSNFPLQKWESIKNINLLDSCSFSWSNVQQENFKSLYSIMYRLFSCIYSFWSWISISMATLRCTFYTVSFIFQWWKGTLWIIYNNQLFRKIEELLRILFKHSYYLLEARAWAAGYEKPSNRSPSNIEFAGDLNTNSNFRF